VFGTIVLAVDGSEASVRATRLAREVALAVGSEVVAVHVREGAIGPTGVWEVERREDARDILNETMASLKDAGVNVRGQLWPGVQIHIATQVVDVARQEDADLIVLGSHDRFSIENVTERVLRDSDIPVLVVA
jgi:nucleotide-binding universal stress UspA family protein